MTTYRNQENSKDQCYNGRDLHTHSCLAAVKQLTVKAHVNSIEVLSIELFGALLYSVNVVMSHSLINSLKNYYITRSSLPNH